jgi:bacillithiol biosynthesis cysteine-adding enzyme BshC
MHSAGETPFNSLSGFSRLFLDYVAGNPDLNTLYDFRPDQKGYEYAIRKVNAGQYNRNLLCDVITKQYESSGAPLPAQLIDRLLQNNSCTVTTGHQLCIAGGPAYFVYKIASVIQLAEKLSAMYNANVVPVYWMASEDHDIDEIRSVNLFGKKITWNTEQTGAAGRLQLNDLHSALEEIVNTLGGSQRALEVAAALKEIYSSGNNLADATRSFVQWLFGDRVIVVDPQNGELKKLAAAVFRDDLINGNAEKLVNETSNWLNGKLYDVQVNPRRINLFHLSPGKRERIEKTETGFRLADSGKEFSESELLEALSADPESFSPNVVLRPLFQQIILPNVAYVGGPGELAYWLQYKAMFDHYHVSFPVLQPRYFAVQITAKDLEWMKKNNIAPRDFSENYDEHLKRKLAERAGEELSLENEKEVLNLLRTTITEKAALADSTLRAFADAEMKKAEESLKVVEVRMIRALKQREEVFTGQLKKQYDRILPNGTLQERSESFLSLYVNTGIKVEDLLNSELFPVSGVRFITTEA